MNLRHAAALAMMGWYLILPPMPMDSVTGIGPTAPDAPLSKWTIIESFDTAGDCEQRKTSHEKDIMNELLKFNEEGHWSINPSGYRDPKYAKPVAILMRGMRAVCIASDDPRLKQ
jgi:hypothetical protein